MTAIPFILTLDLLDFLSPFLVEWVLAGVPAGAGLDLVIDETLERRWGSQIHKRGHYRDSALQSQAIGE